MDKLRKSWMLYAVLVCAVVGLVFASVKIVTGPDTQDQTAQGEIESPIGTEREEQIPEVPKEQEQEPEPEQAETNEPVAWEQEKNVPTKEVQQPAEATQSNPQDPKGNDGNQLGNTTAQKDTETPTDSSEQKTEEVQAHEHTWSVWNYYNDEEEIRNCSSCKSVETRPHSFAKVETTYKDNKEGFHEVTEKYACTTCQTAVYENTFSVPHQYDDGKKTTKANKNGTHTITTEWKCKECDTICKEENTENCQFGNWLFDKKSKDIRYCSVCNYAETRPHQTVEQPESNPNSSGNGGGSGSSGVTHQHTWSKWDYQNEKEEVRTCSSCGTKETRPHSFVKVETTSVDDQDGNHEVTEKYACTTCQTAKYESTFTEPHQYDSGIRNATANTDGTHTIKATYACKVCNSIRMDTTQEDCQYGEWQLDENDTDIRKCTQCTNVETRPHEHSTEPIDLVYVYQTSNNDGTHRLEASYTCNVCGQEVTASKNESCDYGDITYEQTGVNDTHLLVRNCKICQYQQEEEGTCEPTGELKLIKVAAQIYEYYDCALCGDWCLRKYHTEHRFESWEDHGTDEHIRYCICVEARETAEHNFVKQNGTLICQDCGKTVDISDHDHGHGVYDDMDLMDIIFSPAYGELITSNQIANPNPSPYSYCFRYDFRCPKCGIKYSVHQSHTFKDGKCIGGYCGHIEEPQSDTATEPEEQVTTLEPENIPQVEALPKQEEPQGEEVPEEGEKTSEDSE